MKILCFEIHYYESRGQNLFFTFYSIRVECEELFVKLIKTLKIKLRTFLNYIVYC